MVWDFTYTINFTNIVRDWIVTICLFVFLCWFVQYLWSIFIIFLNVCHFEWKIRNLSSQRCSLKTTEKAIIIVSLGFFNILKNDMIVHILQWENWRWSHCAFLPYHYVPETSIILFSKHFTVFKFIRNTWWIIISRLMR